MIQVIINYFSASALEEKKDEEGNKIELINDFTICIKVKVAQLEITVKRKKKAILAVNSLSALS